MKFTKILMLIHLCEKNYNFTDDISLNKHKMLEIKYNLTDAVLLGSGDSVEAMPEVISRY